VDTVLRAAKVGVLQGHGALPELPMHEYFCRKAYVGQQLYDITDAEGIMHKSLRTSVQRELGRQPNIQSLRDRERDAKRQRISDEPEVDEQARKTKATFDEICAIALTRKAIEIWQDADPRDFEPMIRHSIVRTSQRLSTGTLFFSIGVVLQLQNTNPYKVGKKVSTLALMVRTHQGKKLVRMDALSNEPIMVGEYNSFNVLIPGYAARDKARKMRDLEHKHESLFSEEDRRQMQEAEEKRRVEMERRQEEDERRKEEAVRKEEEREEVRFRQAQRKAQSGEQWWRTLAANSGDNTEREKAKWSARLQRFEAIANSTAEEGERTNAARLADSARLKLAELSAN